METEEIISLDLNESYWLLDDETYAECCKVPKKFFGTYPDYTELIEDLAQFAGVQSECINIAPGSDEAIRAVIELCHEQKMRALLPLPTFSGYERILMKILLDTKRIYYREENGAFQFPIDEALHAIQQKEVEVVFLCQPNNPLGASLPVHEYHALLDAAREANLLVVVDEAYAEFASSDVLGRINEQPLIVLRTLSKSFGVPGIRLGYGIAGSQYTKQLTDTIFGTLPWPIPGQSVHAARVVLAHKDRLAERRSVLIGERERFFESLKGIPNVQTYPSEANFILIRVPNASEVAEKMMRDGIRVGQTEKKTWDSDAKKLLASTLRLTVPAPEHQDRVTQSLKTALHA